MILPAVTLVRQYETHRLIPSTRGEKEKTALAGLAGNAEEIRDITDLADATDDRRTAENNLLPGITVHELVFGVPYAAIVNAAFCHANPLGSRWNGPDRGAWYAALDLETAQTEVAFHKWAELAEVGWLEEEVHYHDYLADFSADLHDIRGDRRFTGCLAPDSYIASQTLARKLLERGSLGIVYPSVRRRGGICLVCFRPALVANVRRGPAYALRWDGRPKPRISTLKP